MNKKTNASHGTTFLTLFGLIAVGILLNLLVNRVNVALGLPLYLDNIGTIFSALLGGYIPCITVGFLTNIILGIADSYTTYYCVISVLIAVAAVSFSHHMRRLRIKYILLGILTFALLGGVLGGFLTWFINGQSFGEGFAVDFAARMQAFLPVGYIGTNLLSCFLLDLLDKAIVTLIALILYNLLPEKAVHFVQTRSWYYVRMSELEQRKDYAVKYANAAAPSDNMANAAKVETNAPNTAGAAASVKPCRKKRSLHSSLRLKVTLLVAVPTSLVAFAAIGTCIFQYRNSTIRSYTEQGEKVSDYVASKIDVNQLDTYLAEGRSTEGYEDFEEQMYAIRDTSSVITYMYVYRIAEDGTHVIFDLEAESYPADHLGDVIEYNDTIKKYLGNFLAGEEIPVDIVNDKYGWLLTVFRPIRDTAGKTQAYVGVDLGMGHLSSQVTSFLAKMISIFLGLLFLIRTYAVWAAERLIIMPVNDIADAADNFSYESPEARKESLARIEELDIHTGDEIERMYKAFRTATGHAIHYIDEVQKKGEQISRLQNGLILVLADIVESRDKCTGNHVRKTAIYTDIILRQMKKDGIYADSLTEEYIDKVVHSAPLHDIGKIQVPDAILNKDGKLTDEEFKEMQRHTTAGGEIIDKAIAEVGEESDYLNEAKNLATYHHEKWNGKGYPTGISGTDIPLSARVMAVADVLDALLSRRSYKPPFTIENAFDIIREGSGTHFDPEIVRAFFDAEDEIRKAADSIHEE